MDASVDQHVEHKLFLLLQLFSTNFWIIKLDYSNWCSSQERVWEDEEGDTGYHPSGNQYQICQKKRKEKKNSPKNDAHI